MTQDTLTPAEAALFEDNNIWFAYLGWKASAHAIVISQSLPTAVLRNNADYQAAMRRAFLDKLKALMPAIERARMEPEDCQGVMGGKITIGHLMVDRDSHQYCARCGLTPDEVSAARAAGIVPKES